MKRTALALTFILALLLSVLAVSLLFGAVQAATDVSNIPKPSVPEFTLKFIDNSYDVPPTYEVDPYTGETVTHAGYRVINKSIEVIIKDPPPSNYGAFYDVRFKGHFEDEESWSEAVFRPPNYPQGLVITFSSTEEGHYYSAGLPSYLVYAPSGGQVDFQVQAMNGHYTQVPDEQPQLPWSTGYLTVFIGERSAWSDTQTLTIGESQSPTPLPIITPAPISPTPTPTPYNEAQSTEQAVILGVAIAVAVIGAGLGLLVYLIKRK